MATKKTVVKKPLTIVQRIKEEVAKLKKLGYDFEEESEDQSALYHDKNRSLSIELTANSLPFCCGVSEYGDLSMSNRLTKDEKPIMKSLIKIKLLQIKQDSVGTSKAKVPVGSGIILCSNGLSGWELIEEVLETELFDEYILASTTRNGARGNVIKVFVAKF